MFSIVGILIRYGAAAGAGAFMAWRVATWADAHALDQANLALANTRTDLATSQANVRTLKGAVDGQNAAVAALKAAGDRKEREASAAVAAARSDNAGLTALAARLAARKAGADLCGSADALILDSARAGAVP